MKLNNNKSLPKASRPLAKAVAKPAASTEQPDVQKVEEVNKSAATTNRISSTKENIAASSKTAETKKPVAAKPDTILFNDVVGAFEAGEGIPLNEKYRIKTLDVLNIALQEQYIPQSKKDGDDNNIADDDTDTDQAWKTVGYCPSIEVAWKTIVDREINLTVSKGLEAIVKMVEDLKKLKVKIEENL